MSTWLTEELKTYIENRLNGGALPLFYITNSLLPECYYLTAENFDFFVDDKELMKQFGYNITCIEYDWSEYHDVLYYEVKGLMDYNPKYFMAMSRTRLGGGPEAFIQEVWRKTKTESYWSYVQ